MITPEKAELINARVVAEAANAPTTPEGDVALQQRGIEILPAILCNAGGVTVSYFEWVQNKSSVYWTAEEVDERLNTHMVLAARRVKVARVKYECDMQRQTQRREWAQAPRRGVGNLAGRGQTAASGGRHRPRLQRRRSQHLLRALQAQPGPIRSQPPDR